MTVPGTLVVVANLTMDGVMQGPGRPDEDRRGGFDLGGWALRYGDSVMAGALAEGMAKEGGALLFGRRTYEDFFAVWPSRTDNPYTEVLNKTTKYVASNTLQSLLPWSNSILLSGDVAVQIRRLKKDGQDLTVLGSGVLIDSLIREDLIDEYLLLVYPLVLGQGRRFFPDGVRTTLDLTASLITTTGVTINRYRSGRARPS
jgi:dihydrofolate reductase